MQTPKNMPPLAGARERFHEASKTSLETNIERMKRDADREMALLDQYVSDFLAQGDMEAVKQTVIAMQKLNMRLEELNRLPSSRGVATRESGQDETFELTDQDFADVG